MKYLVNGSTSYFTVFGYVGSNSDHTYASSMQLKLEAGDYVEVTFTVGAGGVSNGEAYSGFLGRLVG